MQRAANLITRNYARHCISAPPLCELIQGTEILGVRANRPSTATHAGFISPRVAALRFPLRNEFDGKFKFCQFMIEPKWSALIRK